MKVQFTHDFIKIYKKRFSNNKNISAKFEKRLRLFAVNSKDPQLLDHALTGKMKGFRSFSITGDIRVIYYIINETTYFVDIGTHSQVYGR